MASKAVRHLPQNEGLDNEVNLDIDLAICKELLRSALIQLEKESADALLTRVIKEYLER